MSRWNEETAIEPRTPARIGSRFGAHAKRAIEDNPDYFVWWYTVKSMLLVAAIGVASFFAGKSRGLEKKP